jgi:hypothetical protein
LISHTSPTPIIPQLICIDPNSLRTEKTGLPRDIKQNLKGLTSNPSFS